MDNEITQCTNTVITWMTSGGAAVWLERLYWFGGAVIAIIAMLALINRNKQAKANFLLHLSERWEGMKDVRQVVGEIKKDVINDVCSKNPHLTDSGKDQLLRNAYKAKITDIRDSDPKTYILLITQLCGFFEIVGIMVKNRYVPLNDIAGLLKGPIEDFETIFKDHIDDRQKEIGTPDGLFENAIDLAEKTAKKYKN